MAAESKNRQNQQKQGLLASLRKIFTMNIGTIMFGILFLYMASSAIMYIASNHVTSYQVITGPLSRNETYTGLALREESVVSTSTGGYITYYAREGSKINANGPVYALSATKNPESDISLSADDLSRIRRQMSNFSAGFDPSKFNSTYSFKYELDGSILQYAGVNNTSSSSERDDESSSGTSGGFSVSMVNVGGQSVCKSQNDGIVLYSTDGYEGKSLENLQAADFSQASYQEVNLKTQDQVAAGDNIYTIITNERWQLVIPLSDKQAAKLTDRETIRVKFLKDGMTQSGDFELRTIDGSYYGILTFEKGLIRYASDRFLDIELVTNSQTGLKIPLSSIITRDFYKIPSTYLTEGGEENEELGFMRLEKNKGVESQIFVPANVYGVETIPAPEEGGMETYNYYIDKGVFQEGDALINPETKEKFVVGKTGRLDGVYCINKGYSVFRRIEILEKNEEFAIVDDATGYGLVCYDHIVQDASQVNDKDILY